MQQNKDDRERIARPEVVRYSVLVLGLLAYTFSGLNWNVATAAWVAPVLLLFYSRNSRWTGLLLLFFGLALGSAVSKTAENLSGVFLLYITTGLSYGLLYSLPYVFDKLLVKKGTRFYSTLIFPAAVVTIEYALSRLIGIWGNGAIAQYPNSILIQLSSVFGVFGISFLIAWLASTLNWVFKKGWKSKRLWPGPALYGVVLVSVLLFGMIRKNTSPEGEQSVKLAAVLGVCDSHQVFREWEEEIFGLSNNPDQDIPVSIYSDSLDLEEMIRRTNQALSQGAGIVVWNEISLLLVPEQTEALVERVKDLCAKYRAYVLIAVLERNTGNLPMPFNNRSMFIDPEGEIRWDYLKHYLNPLEALVVNAGSGPIPVVDTEYGRMANAICSDLDLPAHISQVGKDNVDILLVPAFDWEEVTLYHAHMAAFAALQYGVQIFRANGKGITALYDSRGRILEQSNSFRSDAKVIFASLPLTRATSLYASIGDLFVQLWMVFLLLMAGLSIFKRADL